MAVIKMPKMFGGTSRPEREPAHDWDDELTAMRGIGEWLATIPSQEGKLRALSYFMWRLKSGDDPRVETWMESIAEQSTMTVSKRAGFSEGVE
jgi:hypothetical protein